MTLPESSQSLWDFALAFYSKAEVANACLYLQDECQANVCLLIGLNWMDTRGQHLTDTDFENLQLHIQSWTQDVVAPLRNLRRKLKLPFEHYIQDETQERVREFIKQAELLAEKKLLDEIESWAKKIAVEKNNAAYSNLENYLLSLNAGQHWLEILRKNASN